MRVLIIEDYQPLRESLEQGLTENGFAVDVASDGETGWWHAQGGEYDVIILDLMLPKLDGLTILKRVRDKNFRTAVLILTARDATEDRVKGLDLGADDYLIKPFAFVELLARVRALIRRNYGARAPIVKVSDLELDPALRVARRGGKSIELSAREYALLEFLMRKAGEIVTRSDIWTHVYSFNSAAESNVVDVYIGHLRRKIEQEGLPRLIHTRRGHGYVLGAAESCDPSDSD
jgi:DNA-binding response OmpR family regulator